MGLGVLEDHKLPHVPGLYSMLRSELYSSSIGTATLKDEDEGRDQPVNIDPNIKYDRTGPVPIILVPQPSDDPNDPLVRLKPSIVKDVADRDRIGRYGSATAFSLCSLSCPSLRRR
jgi:hypothetical protein